MAQLCKRRDFGESGGNSIDHFYYRQGHNVNDDNCDSHNDDYHQGHNNGFLLVSRGGGGTGGHQ